MGRRQDLQAQAKAAGLPTSGTIAELEDRLSGTAGTIDVSVPMRFVGDSPRRFPGLGTVEPGDIVELPEINLQSKLFEPAAGDEPPPTNGQED